MEMHKKILQIIAVGVSVVVMGTSVHTENPELVEIMDEMCALNGVVSMLVEQEEEDINIIPDKYNTGAKGDLHAVTIAESVNGIQFVAGSNGTVNVLDFGYRNKEVVGSVTFENIDFSTFPVSVYNEDKVERKIKVVFKNCRFSKFSSGKTESNLSFEFENCTLNSFYGSNASFECCQFGKSYTDGVVPFINVYVKDSFFWDMASGDESGAGKHTDGTQIYGHKGLDVENVHYENCRFEIPAIQTSADSASVNACLMLQLEYSNAKDVEFRNCIVNGGGYSVFARDTDKGFSFTNVKFSNIQIGTAKLFGNIYPKVSEQILFEEIGNTQNLYVSSVWKENNETHVSVTNDTNQERTLAVYADGIVYEYIIPACPNGDKLYTSYDAFPFDMDIVVPADCEYIVCFDSTLAGSEKQIRYVNWGTSLVYLDQEVQTKLFGRTSAEDSIISEGTCGKNVVYSLSNKGVLTLSGSGATYNFHSTKPVPWTDYTYMINKVVVEEGVETLGTQIFRACDNLNEVILGEGLKNICARAFQGCSTLSKVSLPSTVEVIGEYAFYGTIVRDVTFVGDASTWSLVVIDNNNDLIIKYVKFESEVVTQETVDVVDAGKCGDDVWYCLREDGTLILTGKGATYNYHSRNVAPWYENRQLVKTVRIEDGITALGQQVFNNCSVLGFVELPESLQKIESNAFIRCASLGEIMIPSNVSSISKYAFAGTGLYKTSYCGTVEEWNKIVIGQYNDKLTANIVFGAK